MFRTTLTLVAFALLAAAVSGPDVRAADRPNILVVLSDRYTPILAPLTPGRDAPTIRPIATDSHSICELAADFPDPNIPFLLLFRYPAEISRLEIFLSA